MMMQRCKKNILFPTCVDSSFSSSIMNKNSVQGGAFLSNFSCAYAGRHEGQPGEIASHLPALVGAPGAESK